MGLCDRRRGADLRRPLGRQSQAATKSLPLVSPSAGPFSGEVLRARYIESPIKALQTGW